MAARRAPIRVGAIIAVAAAVGFFAWLVLKDDDGDSRDARERSSGVGPVEVSSAALTEKAGSIDTPVYWAGEVAGRKLEFTETASGRVFVRYLPLGVPIGERRPGFLTIATYPAGNAYGAIRAVGRRKGGTTRIDAGGLLVGGKDSKSVHFSFPGAGYQVEVFSPDPGRSRRLVLDGNVQPVR